LKTRRSGGSYSALEIAFQNKFDKNSQPINCEKLQLTKTNRVYDGTIENGIRMTISILWSKKSIKIDFKELVKKNNDYYLEILKPKPN
jgi:hypothetical protein